MGTNKAQSPLPTAHCLTNFTNMKLTKSQKDWIEIAVYIFLGYLIAVGANKGMAYALQTDFPVVAVVSRSMEHANPTETHYPFLQEKSLTIEQIKNLPFDDGIRMGDIVVVRGAPLNEIKAGDVVVYKFPGREPIIHRVVEITEEGLITKGDNNRNIDQINEGIATPIKAENLKGKAILHIPLLGYVKIIYLKITARG